MSRWQAATLVFFTLFALDFIWAKYTVSVTAQRPLQAAAYAAVLYLLTGVATVSYTSDPWALLPAASAGAFCGTFASVWRDKYKANWWRGRWPSPDGPGDD